MQNIKTKEVDSVEHPITDFAYTPDPQKPSTWKLPIFDMRHIAGAEAALNSDYRGNPVEIPAGAIDEVRRKIAQKKKQILESRYD